MPHSNLENKETSQNIRQMAVVGQFYPANADELEAMIDGYLEGVASNPSTSSGQAPQIIIAPHAGFIYSGQVAGFSFKQLENSGFERAIIIGRSHQQYFEGVAADGNDAWQTPFGNVLVDKDFINQLASSTNIISIDSSVHKTEHSLEVELPFLVKALGRGIKIVPLLFGDDDISTSLELAKALEKNIDEKTVVIVSSDLSHYPQYEVANKLDRKTIETILSLNTEKLNQIAIEAENGNIPQVATLACAEPAIITAMALAKKLNLKPHLLKYANSGDFFPETKDRVVGYAAIAFFKTDGVQGSVAGSANELNKGEQEIALQIARKTLEAHFKGREYQVAADLTPVFQGKRGVFVTLKEQGNLRGCIGNFTPDIDLAENIKEMALSAAFSDPRFFPLERQELKNIEIEISVLSPMQKITDPILIEIGKHGVYVKKGARAGVYLPQVATEMGWNKEQFLNSLCEEKVGLDANCWKDGSVDLYIFTAQVFNESSE